MFGNMQSYENHVGFHNFDVMKTLIMNERITGNMICHI